MKYSFVSFYLSNFLIFFILQFLCLFVLSFMVSSHFFYIFFLNLHSINETGQTLVEIRSSDPVCLPAERQPGSRWSQTKQRAKVADAPDSEHAGLLLPALRFPAGLGVAIQGHQRPVVLLRFYLTWLFVRFCSCNSIVQNLLRKTDYSLGSNGVVEENVIPSHVKYSEQWCVLWALNV